ncbi:MAG: methyltransferase domain-containing protein [Acidobacteriota bacterium]
MSSSLKGHDPGAVFYQPDTPYQHWLLDEVAQRLALQPSDRLADLGCGAGAFAAALAKRERLTVPAVGVELDAAHASEARELGLTVLDTDLEGFAAGPAGGFDALLAKEVIHHVAEERLREVLTGLLGRLNVGGRLLLVTRPREVDYPLFAAARQAWRDQQPEAEDFAEILREAGAEVSLETASWRWSLPRVDWWQLVRNRFWSVFRGFDDAALEAGLAELADELGPGDTVEFDDRLVFILARRGETTGRA